MTLSKREIRMFVLDEQNVWEARLQTFFFVFIGFKTPEKCVFNF